MFKKIGINNIFYLLYILLNLFLLFAFLYNHTKLNTIVGSDDGLIYHDLHTLFINGTIPFTSTLYVLLLYFFSKINGITQMQDINSFILFLNVLSLGVSAFFIAKIVKQITKNNFVSFFSITLFLLTSSVVFGYMNRATNYLLPLLFEIISFYYFLQYQKESKFNYAFLTLFFAQLTFLVRRIWQLYAFLIVICIAFEIIKKKKFRHFFFIFIFNFSLFLPWFLWRYLTLGKHFYIDEYSWIFDKEISSVIASHVWNPPASYNLLTSYFSETSYPTFGMQIFYILAVTIPLLTIYLFIKKKINKTALLITIILFLLFQLLPVLSPLARPINRYSLPGFPFLIIILCLLLSLFSNIIKNIKIRVTLAFLLLIICLIGTVNASNTIFDNYDSSYRLNQLFQKDAVDISKIIDKNNNILFRSYFIEQNIYKLNDKGSILSIINLKKDDAINYLTWENDPIGILKKYNIKYIFAYKNYPDLEYGFYPWLKETYKKEPKYLDGITADNRIKEIYNGMEIIVYEIQSK